MRQRIRKLQESRLLKENRLLRISPEAFLEVCGQQLKEEEKENTTKVSKSSGNCTK